MGGAAPPFLYGANTNNRSPDRGFNPKVVTQASWSPRQPRPKQKGPLVNFNQHPDSVSVSISLGRRLKLIQAQHQVTAYTRPDVKPMSPRTKIKVKYTRLVQLFLRICALLGALGMLFCVICIKDTTVPVAWIIRVAVSEHCAYISYLPHADCFIAFGGCSSYNIRSLPSLSFPGWASTRFLC